MIAERMGGIRSVKKAGELPAFVYGLWFNGDSSDSQCLDTHRFWVFSPVIFGARITPSANT